MARMELQDWMKTSESRHILEAGKVFCVDGLLWQGFKGSPMPVEESQLTMEEMKNVDDRDGSMHVCWFRVKQRLEARYQNKSKEYGKRRSEVRGERNAIRESMEKDAALNIKPNPADIDEIERLDARMTLLRDPGLEDAYTYARDHSTPPDEEAASPPVPERGPEPQGCPECDATCPDGKNYDKWLRGHTMGKHRRRATG